MTIQVLAEADADLLACIWFYNSRRGKYGKAMKLQFTRALRAIASSPRLYSLVEDELPGFEMREYFIGNFEQRVIYHMGEDTISVVAIVHASRRGGSWHRRLDTL